MVGTLGARPRRSLPVASGALTLPPMTCGMAVRRSHSRAAHAKRLRVILCVRMRISFSCVHRADMGLRIVYALASTFNLPSITHEEATMSDLSKSIRINEKGPREGFRFEKGPIATARKVDLIDASSLRV